MDSWITPYKTFLEQVLTPNRLAHSIGVMQVMGELAGIYGLDREKSLLAGLLHDGGKDLTLEQQAKVIADEGLSLQSPWEQDYVNYMHGPVGAYFIRKALGMSDPLIFDAIYMHTYCGNGIHFEDPLVWCLRFSDLLEPNRRWDQAARILMIGTPRLRELVFGGRLEEAAFFQTGMVIRFFEERGHFIHPNLQRVYDEHSARLGLDGAWFSF